LVLHVARVHMCTYTTEACGRGLNAGVWGFGVGSNCGGMDGVTHRHKVAIVRHVATNSHARIPTPSEHGALRPISVDH
jgi:hypothetical protein